MRRSLSSNPTHFFPLMGAPADAREQADASVHAGERPRPEPGAGDALQPHAAHYRATAEAIDLAMFAASSNQRSDR